MRCILLGLAALLLLATPVVAQQTSNGGIYEASPATLVDGQRTGLLTDVNRRLIVGGYKFNGSTWDKEFTCTSSVAISVAAAATQELVALVASQVVRVCSFVISGDTLATTATFKYGTGTTCGTGTVSLTGAMRMPDEGSIALSAPSGGSLFRSIASNALCITAATGAVTGFLTYAQF